MNIHFATSRLILLSLLVSACGAERLEAIIDMYDTFGTTMTTGDTTGTSTGDTASSSTTGDSTGRPADTSTGRRRCGPGRCRAETPDVGGGGMHHSRGQYARVMAEDGQVNPPAA